MRQSTLGPVTIAVFDIDGVVADVRHRLHFLDRSPKNWHRFFQSAATDNALSEGAELARIADRDHELVWLTGRPEWIRDLTVDWLAACGLPAGRLLMRRPGDHRAARLMKIEVLQSLSREPGAPIIAFVDDDPEVITAATRAGFPATLAEWVPRGRSLAEAQEKLGRT